MRQTRQWPQVVIPSGVLSRPHSGHSIRLPAWTCAAWTASSPPQGQSTSASGQCAVSLEMADLLGVSSDATHRRQPLGAFPLFTAPGRYRLVMLRWAGAAVAAAAMTGFAFLLLSGQYIREGPVLLSLTETHGIHRGDVGIVAVWALGMLGLLVALRAGRVERP